MQVERGLVMVIHEEDVTDGNRTVIGVVTNRKEALKMIEEYYGISDKFPKEEATLSEFRDIREDNFDFSCIVTVSGFLGGTYKVWAEDFNINSL